VGHLLLILVSLGLGGAIQLQHGVDADFPDSLGQRGLLGAYDEFALVFVAAEFSFDSHVRAFGSRQKKMSW
jgi:hypothetical protein